MLVKSAWRSEKEVQKYGYSDKTVILLTLWLHFHSLGNFLI